MLSTPAARGGGAGQVRHHRLDTTGVWSGRNKGGRVHVSVYPYNSFIHLCSIVHSGDHPFNNDCLSIINCVGFSEVVWMTSVIQHMYE